MTQAATDATPPAVLIAAAMARLGLTVESTFVPFSKSRKAKPRKDGKVWRSLNWTVRILRNGREILATDYSQGEGGTPAYKAVDSFFASAPYALRRARDELIAWEVEHGKAGRWLASSGSIMPHGKPLQPDPCDVVASLVMDSSVLDAGGFEDWASEHGYDTDSREAESTYRARLEIALKLRAAIGEEGLTALRGAGRGY